MKLEVSSPPIKETKSPKEKKSKDKQKKEKKARSPKHLVNGIHSASESAEVENGENDYTPKEKKTKSPKQLANGKTSTTNEVEEVENGQIDQDLDHMVKGGKECPELSKEEVEGAFSNFPAISEKSIAKLQERGIKHLFPIQAKTFNYVFDGEDVIGQARTGTGKTLAFSLPLVEMLQRKAKKLKSGRPPKVLVMAPTRELARQVSEDFQMVSDNLSVFCIYGGTPYGPQESAIRSGLDVLVGTPGRILDHVQKGNLNFSKLKHVILDEVDQMLDMGFAESVDSILEAAYNRGDAKKKPQTMLFSATLPQWVHDTAKKYMRDDVKTVDLIGQQEMRTATTVQHLAIQCSYWDRPATIGDVIQVYSGSHGRAMVFCQTKKDADELAVSESIKQDSHVLHGDIPQEKREMVLKSFKQEKYKVLITTDVAARGLDIPTVDLVIQCNPPKDVESYIHRSGRTGRAGRSGICICFYKPQEENSLQYVERVAGIKFKKVGGPTKEDIITAAADDAARSLDNVPTETLQYFRKSAETLIAERGGIDALSAALAVISGSTKIVSRSLLSSKEGFTTYVFRTNIEMRTISYAWRALENQLSYDVKEKITRMRFCKDKMGCVFDLPSDSDSHVAEKWTDGRFDSLKIATELPELLEFEGNSGSGFSRGGRGGFRGNSFGRGGQNRSFQSNRFGGGGGGGFQSRGGGRGRGRGGGQFGHFKRSGSDQSGPVNKRMRFDD